MDNPTTPTLMRINVASQDGETRTPELSRLAIGDVILIKRWSGTRHAMRLAITGQVSLSGSVVTIPVALVPG